MKKDLTNKKFGHLLVIKEAEKLERLHNRISWLCLCDCGNITKKTTTNLTSGNSTKCSTACKLIERYNFKDLSNQKFNKLTVLEKLEEKTKTRGVVWLCKCECGNLIKLSSNAITSGNNTSCGCTRYKIEKIGNIPICFLNKTKQNATNRNLQFDVSYEYLCNIFTGKCALSGLDIGFIEAKYQKNKIYSTASLDRIDNRLPYIEGNVQWVHKDINIMKNKKSDKDFIAICKTVSDFNT